MGFVNHIMTFGNSISVKGFKEANNTATLNVVRNPKTSKLFITGDAGNTLAAVSSNYDSSKDKQFTELIIEDGSKIWCLTNVNTDNVVETL